MLRDIGILGTGLWRAPRVGNEVFGDAFGERAEVRDPYKGRRAQDGTVRIAGMEFHPVRHARTLAAIDAAFGDPYRGTRFRRWLPHDAKVSDAETDAARRALDDAGIEAKDVDALLVQSFLPDQIQPKNDALVAHNLGIERAPAWGVDSVCNSPVSQATVAASLVASGQARHVLCVQSVAYSRVMDRTASSSVQEGDMASAFVVGPREGARVAFAWRTQGRLHAAIKLAWMPPAGSAPRRWWERAEDRLLIAFDQELQAQTMSEIASQAPIVCEEALRRAELRLEDIDLFVSHQPMAWYTAFIADVLGLRDEVLFDSFLEYANVNSASITATLHEARRHERIRPGSNVLVFGPAAGYTYGAMAMRW